MGASNISLGGVSKDKKSFNARGEWLLGVFGQFTIASCDQVVPTRQQLPEDASNIIEHVNSAAILFLQTRLDTMREVQPVVAPNWWKSGDKLCVLGFWPKTWRDGWIGLPHQTLWTEEVPWRFGGQRFYFRCDCGRRVEKLHSARGKPWRCRHCYVLTYATRQATARERERIKTQKIRERLGGSLYFGDEFPAKPKGMHWKRYWRLWTEHEDAKNYFLAMTGARILQLKSR
jgi:hypothetical protein